MARVKRDKAFYKALYNQYIGNVKHKRFYTRILVVRGGKLLHKAWIEPGRKPDYEWWKRARTWRGFQWRRDVVSVEEITDEGNKAWLLTLQDKPL